MHCWAAVIGRSRLGAGSALQLARQRTVASHNYPHCHCPNEPLAASTLPAISRPYSVRRSPRREGLRCARRPRPHRKLKHGPSETVSRPYSFGRNQRRSLPVDARPGARIAARIRPLRRRPTRRGALLFRHSREGSRAAARSAITNKAAAASWRHVSAARLPASLPGAPSHRNCLSPRCLGAEAPLGAAPGRGLGLGRA